MPTNDESSDKPSSNPTTQVRETSRLQVVSTEPPNNIKAKEYPLGHAPPGGEERSNTNPNQRPLRPWAPFKTRT
jgi:hypothetical protein